MDVVLNARSKVFLTLLIILSAFSLGACRGKNSKTRIDRSYTDPNQRAGAPATQEGQPPGQQPGDTGDPRTPEDGTTTTLDVASLPKEPLLDLFATAELEKVREKFPAPASDYKAVRIARVGDLADENLKLVVRFAKEMKVEECNEHKLPVKIETKEISLSDSQTRQYSYVSVGSDLESTDTECTNRGESEKKIEGNQTLQIEKLAADDPYGYVIYLPKDTKVEVDAYSSNEIYELSESNSEINYELHESAPEGYETLEENQRLGVLNLNGGDNGSSPIKILIGRWVDSGACPPRMEVSIEKQADETADGEKRLAYFIEETVEDKECDEPLTERKFVENDAAHSIDITDFSDVEYDFIFSDELDLQLHHSTLQTTIAEP